MPSGRRRSVHRFPPFRHAAALLFQECGTIDQRLQLRAFAGDTTRTACTALDRARSIRASRRLSSSCTAPAPASPARPPPTAHSSAAWDPRATGAAPVAAGSPAEAHLAVDGIDTDASAHPRWPATLQLRVTRRSVRPAAGPRLRPQLTHVKADLARFERRLAVDLETDRSAQREQRR